MLAENNYGKSGIRLVKVARHGDRHEIHDLTVAVSLEGSFVEAHVLGDNSAVLPTDTMKNTVYVMARSHPLDSIESFALELSKHFLDESPAASVARVEIAAHPWERLPMGSGGHPHAFRKPGGETRTAKVTRTRDGFEVRAGIEGLTILKSARSAFKGFFRNRYTTLKETEDRIFATRLTALWRYGSRDTSYSLLARAVRATLLETFADHASASVQHTLHAMGEAALDRHPEIDEIRLSMPNKHHILADLSPFGLDNANEVFVATEEPFGLIEGTLRRTRTT
jgi:urate oxidase